MTSFSPGTFAPAPGRGRLSRMLLTQARTEFVLTLRNGEQVLLTLLIPLGMLIGLTVLNVVPVPGPSAVIAALSAAGIPADSFVFDGFLPVKPGKRIHRLEALRGLEMTVVCYESPHRALASLEAIGQV